MKSPKVISFDAEGTLVTPEFSIVVWRQALPEMFARKNGISCDEAREYVRKEYERLGEHCVEWYDISYWFGRWGLGDYRELLENHRNYINYYPETKEVLSRLSRSNKMIVSSASSRQFLNMLMEDIGDNFASVFSSISDYGLVKTENFYRKVCEVMDVQPEDIVHVGDSWDFDFVAPGKMGIRAYYLDREGVRQGPNVVKNLQEFVSKVLEMETPQ